MVVGEVAFRVEVIFRDFCLCVLELVVERGILFIRRCRVRLGVRVLGGFFGFRFWARFFIFLGFSL